jgi:hypothetical protein
MKEVESEDSTSNYSLTKKDSSAIDKTLGGVIE